MRERTWITVVVLVVLLGFAWPGGHVRAADRVVELLLVGLMVVVVLRAAPVQKVLSKLPLRLQVLSVALTLAIYAGHVFGESRLGFPFIPWTMYTGAPDGPVRTYLFTGTTASGETVDIVPTARDARLRTSLVPFGLHEQAERVTRDIERGRPPLAFARLHGNLLALARLHPEPITQVQVTQVTLPPEGLDPTSAERRVVWEFEVP